MQFRDLQRKYSGAIPTKDLRLIIQKVLNISALDLVTQANRDLSAREETMLGTLIQKRLSGMPVARIFEEWEFWGLPFYLSDETLVPRPDTETVIEAVLKKTTPPPKKILDLGTGSGCILIALLSEYPDAFGVGIDLSENAIKTARRNAVRNNVISRSEFIQADWGAAIQGTFDVIVSNPPYIESADIDSLMVEVREYDPILALDGGKDGLDSIKIILEHIKNCFTETTRAFFEIGYNQANSVMKLIEEYGFSTTEIHLDLSGHKRVIEFNRPSDSGDKNKKNESQG